VSDRPPLWAVIGTLFAAPVFIGLVLTYVPYTLCGWRFAPPFLGQAWTRWLGVALIVLALPVLADFLVRFVREGHGTPAPVAPPERLVVRGVFRYVRNPSYVAGVAAVVGQGLLFASVEVLVYALALAVGFHLFVVLYEEPTLRRKFGAAYEAYCRDVGRWLPRF